MVVAGNGSAKGKAWVVTLLHRVGRYVHVMREGFHRFAANVAHVSGSAPVFVGAVLVVLVWAATGPIFAFSDTWQLIINTGTTVVTFLMVFLIQNTQNRDSRALHAKLDELIARHETADNALLVAEDLSDAELNRFKQRFAELASQPASHANGDGSPAALTGSGTRPATGWK
jgi:low affinity Fe/Cu permease